LADESQPKLLRFLQEREYRRLGDTKDRPANLRILAATNDPSKLAPDLLDRFKELVIETQPLGDRLEGIICLTNHFLAINKTKAGRGPQAKFADPRVKVLLYCHRFEGNVRELEQLVNIADSYQYFTESIKSDLRQQYPKLDCEGIIKNSYRAFEEPLVGVPMTNTSILAAMSYLEAFPKLHKYDKLAQAFEVAVLHGQLGLGLRGLKQALHISEPPDSEQKYRP
jgi:DNA-binding NtrC family response regulator